VCGIAGILDPDLQDDLLLQVMLDAIRHRGPDDEGFFVDSGACLGHRRLSIIDLDGGHQPLCNESGRLWIVFNGEIYNYQELREILIARGHSFRTDSDTEVLLHLYQEYKENCLGYLRGMFSFAIWDMDNRELFAARDHLGQKPFYYSLRDRKFAFCSEIKGLLAYDPSLRKINVQALEQYLSLRVIAPPRSMFQQISKLPPAHFLKFKASGELEVKRYWHLHYEPKHDTSDDDLVDELEERLTETLRLHMISDVPVGAFMSGGLDSTLVVSMLREKVGVERLKTFTIGLPYKQFDETPYARLVAQKYGTDHVEKVLTPSLVPQIIDLVNTLDEPSDPLSVCSYMIAELARKDVKVVIGGDGGDELFGGYDRYYANLYAAYLRWIPDWLRKQTFGRILNRVPDGRWYKNRTHQIKWLYQMSFEKGGARYARSLGFSYINPNLKNVLYGSLLSNAKKHFNAEDDIRQAYESADAIEEIDKMLSADCSIRLPDHSVMILDRMSMAHSLEVRSPYMDHRLAEFSAQLPMRMKVRGRNLRYIQKQLAKRYLPEEVLNMPKQGFSSALIYMLKDESRLLFSYFLSGSRLAQEGYFLQSGIDTLLEEHMSKRFDHGNRLWLLLNAEIWYRLYIDQETSKYMKESLLYSLS
jgi:asparagine synthase (glutamine-hydrolysing)